MYTPQNDGPPPESIALRGIRPEYAFHSYAEFKTVQAKLYTDNHAPIVADEDRQSSISFYVEESGILDRRLTLDDRERVAVDCIDEFLAFFMLAAAALSRSEPNAFFDADRLLLRNIISDLTAIRVLIRSGLTTACLKLCRPLQESVDTLILSQHDEVFADEFSKSMDPQRANDLWHKFIAKQKVVKRIKEKSDGYRILGKTQFAAIADGLMPLLGAAIHPSALVSFMCTTHDAPFAQTGERDDAFSRPYPMMIFVAYTCWLALVFGLRTQPSGGRRSIIDRMSTGEDRYPERWAAAIFDTFVLVVSANANKTAGAPGSE